MKPTALLTLGSAFAPRLVLHAHTTPLRGFAVRVAESSPFQKKPGCVRPVSPIQAEKNPYQVYLMSSIYMYLKNKSSNANSTHLKKESSTLGFPPSSCWLGPVGSRCRQVLPTGTGDIPGQGQEAGWTIPTCSVVWHSRGSV